MMFKTKRSFESEAFDMTPIIDMVFLLIIFFMLVSQFIAAEQFKVNVPDQIQTAQSPESAKKTPLTITVLPEESGQDVCMVGPQRLSVIEGKEMAVLIESAINDGLAERKDNDKTIRLRCDKSVSFGRVKYILAGIYKSQAENLEWAVLSE